MEKPNLEQPQVEKPQRQYIYWDQSQKPRKLIFECVAPGILAADELYKEATGNDPEKQKHVGCELGEIVKE